MVTAVAVAVGGRALDSDPKLVVVIVIYRQIRVNSWGCIDGGSMYWGTCKRQGASLGRLHRGE